MQFIDQIQEIYIRYLKRLVFACMRRPAATLAIGIIWTFVSLGYAAFNLPINSEQENLVARDNEFLKRETALSEAFPNLDHTILTLISGEDSWQVNKSAEQLAEALRARPDLFKSVFYPQDMDFFRQNGLLYLDTEDVAQFVDGLAKAQPAIAELARDSNLRGLFTLLADGVQAENEDDTELPESFDLIIEQIAIAVETFLAGRQPDDIWREAFPDWISSDQEHSDFLQLIIVQPHLDFSDLLSGRKGVEGLQQIAADLRLREKGIQVQLTGREPLTFDELKSILFNIEIAGVISVISIIIILGFGIRSWRIILAIMATLLIGISWSFGWAAITVGELNMISAAFAVLFLGISVDFAIHVVLRYREELAKINGSSQIQAMEKTLDGAGGAISLCGLATAIGFLSFVPTDYFALRDLGIIAGGSMFLALVASFTILPALMTYLPLSDMTKDASDKKNTDIFRRFSPALYEWIRVYFRPITLLSFALAIAAAPFALQMGFDYSALAIKDPSSESIISLKKLQARGLYSDYTANVLTENRQEAEKRAKKLETLPLVRSVATHKSLVPENQEEKIEILFEALFFMAPVFSAESLPTPSDQSFAEAAKKLVRAFAGKKKTGTDLPAAQQRLAKALTALLRHPDALDKFKELNTILTGDFSERLALLEQSLQAETFTFDDLPQNVREQTQAEDGRIRITIFPEEDMTDPDALVRFVKILTEADDQIGGRPVVEYAVGQLTVKAFQTALGLAVISITLILLISLRSFQKTALVLAPIMLAGIYTLAACVWLDISFNFVNVLLLPLLLGLGVANGIHILSRAQVEKNVREVMHSSTPVAVFLSNTTTLVTFGSLTVTTHLGMRSMGITLTISMIFMIICALIVLPAILAWMRHRATLKQPA